MVAHDEETVAGHDDLAEAPGGAVRGLAVHLPGREGQVLEDIGLGEGLTVDEHPSLRIAAGDLVAGESDDALDRVVRVARPHSGDVAGQPHRLLDEAISGGASGLLPRVSVPEDDDVAAGDGVVEAVDDDAIADLKRVLHRLRGHSEGLDQEGLDQSDSRDGENDLEADR